MKILAIETSCDETGIAVVEASGNIKKPRFRIFKNLVASQVKVHRPFGGVVPSLAKREHQKNLPILLDRLTTSACGGSASGGKNQQLKTDLVAVTVGPGLEPALWEGINFAKQLYQKLKTKNPKLKIIGVNHLEGHLYSIFLTPKYQKLATKLFPAIALIISGGHTILLLMKDTTHYSKLGETRDDAVGEAFDKVARLLGLPYPGGPEIEKLALSLPKGLALSLPKGLALSLPKGWRDTINFPRPMINQKNYDFSFSGLKTAVLYYLRDSVPQSKTARRDYSDIAASFQKAAFDVLIYKTMRAAKEFGVKSIMVSGGVAANKTLAKMFKQEIKKSGVKTNLLITEFPGDNAAMIAASAYINFLKKKNKKLRAQGGLNL